MFIVAPSGSEKLATLGDTRSFSVVLAMVTGRVAALDRVVNAIMYASRMPRNRRIGVTPPIVAAIATSTHTWTRIPPITVPQYQPRVSKTSGPLRATRPATMHPIAIGEMDISQWVTRMMTAFRPWKKETTWAAGFPTIVQAIPNSNAKKMIPRELGGLADRERNGLDSRGRTMSSLKMSPAVRPRAPASFLKRMASSPAVCSAPSCCASHARYSWVGSSSTESTG